MSSEGQLFRLISDFGSVEGRAKAETKETVDASDVKSSAAVAEPLTKRAGRAAGTGKLEAGSVTDTLPCHHVLTIRVVL